MKKQDAKLDDICQNYSFKQEAGQLLANKKLATIFYQFFKDSLSENKLKLTVNMYLRPENCTYTRAQLSSAKIWRLNLTAPEIKSHHAPEGLATYYQGIIFFDDIF